MDIAVIGAGNVGKALSGAFVRAGNTVTISSAHPETAKEAAKGTGATPVDSNRAAAAAGDVVVLAVPYPTLPVILDDLGDALRGKVVIDATNPMRDIGGTSAAEEIQAKTPEARVVKAFNTVFATRQADPVVGGVAMDAFVAGDDEAAKATVLELAKSIGFEPIDAGPLKMARALEAMAALNIDLQLRNGWTWQTAWKLVGPKAA